MEPPNISDELRIQTKLMHAQLLIKTHTKSLIEKVRDMYWIEMDIRSMKSANDDILIHLKLEDITSDYSISTIGCHQPTRNIIQELGKHIDRDIDLLYELVQHKEQKYVAYISENTDDKASQLSTIVRSGKLYEKKTLEYPE